MTSSFRSPEEPQWDIFLSFPSEIEKEASALYASLLRIGANTFFAPESMKGLEGAKWPNILEKALNNAKVVVVVVSPETRRSTYQMDEVQKALGLAKSRGTLVVPIMLNGIVVKDLPMGLGIYQGIWMEQTKQGFDEVARSVSELLLQPVEQSRHLAGAVLHCRVVGPPPFAIRSRPNGSIALLQRELGRFEGWFDSLTWVNLESNGFTLFQQLGDRENPFDTLTRCIAFGAHLLLFVANRNNKMNPGDERFELAVAVHWEREGEWCNPPTSQGWNGSQCLVGPGIEEARQLLSVFCERPYLILSDRAYEELGGTGLEKRILSELRRVGSGKNGLQLPGDNDAVRVTPMSVYDMQKNERRALSIEIVGSDGSRAGTDHEPPQLVAIEYRAPSDDLSHNTFVQHLTRAKRVCIVGVTHEGLDRFLRAAVEARKLSLGGDGFWDDLSVIFPSEAFLKMMIDQHDHEARAEANRIRADRWKLGRRMVSQYLLSLPSALRSRWKCLEFPGNLAFVGQRFEQDDSSSIRVAPLLAGADVKDSYYLEVFNGSRAYKQLTGAFDVIVNRSEPIVEWTVCLSAGESGFSFNGIIGPERQSEARAKFHISPSDKACFPVVLVVLHYKGYAVLQNRTIFNSARDFDKYSNISGWVTSDDLINAVSPDPKAYTRFIADNYRADQQNESAATNEFTLAMGNQIAQDTMIPAELLNRSWLSAAVRELREELGIEVTPTRLTLHQAAVPLNRPNDDFQNMFRIFSLKLNPGELEEIAKQRPRSALEELTWKQLEEFHRNGRFNRLLQNRFDDIFTPLYKELCIR